MTLADIRKGHVKSSYDREAERYRGASPVQQFMLSRLLSLADAQIMRLKPKRILDIGCGFGPAVAAFMQSELLHDIHYLGIDLSPKMIALARDTYGSGAIQFAVGDAEALDVEDASVDMVLSNAALHWLNQPQLGSTAKKAFAEMNRVLRREGLLAVSTAAAGKARRFLDVYRRVMSRYLTTAGFTASLYVSDPIGCLELYELVDLASGAGLKVELAQLNYNPSTFSCLEDFFVYIRAYGFNAFMAPLAEELRESVWHEITIEFASTVGSGAYLHDTYTNYLIATKPG